MSKQPSFRQRVINRIRREGLDMQHWTHTGASFALTALDCKTSCCLAGNIALEAGATDVKGSLSSVQGPLFPHPVCASVYAKKVWAEEYGNEEARKLDFYFKSSKQTDMAQVLPSQVIQHLKDIRVR